MNKATYPPELVPRLREIDYRIDVDARKVQESHDALMDEILTTLDRRVRMLLEQYDTGQWDLFIGVVTETDRLQHFFMDAIEDPGHKYHSAFRDFYGKVDNFLGAIVESAPRRNLHDHERPRVHRNQAAGLFEPVADG